MKPADPFIRTRIVATLGPATEPAGRLESLLEAGVNVCRLNFSHGTHAQHLLALERVRAWSTEQDRAVAVLGDLCGPKIRLNTVAGGKATLKVGDRVSIVRGDADCTAEQLTITYPTLLDELSVGHRVFIDDGLVRLLVVDHDEERAVCTCTVGGVISTRKGVNLPDTRLNTPALTDKDRADLEWAIANRLDYVALSFVRTPYDLIDLRKAIDRARGSVGIISKIEKVEALEHLDEILALSNGIMVARGDLGVEMDAWQVPLVQKSLTARCREVGKPVIIATQMLQSMISTPVPTRAEISDVANAILDGVDAVMLSAETASGEFPLAAVEIMRRVATATEAFRSESRSETTDERAGGGEPRAAALAEGAARTALHLGAKLVAVWTTSGDTVRLMARYRLPMPVVGLTAAPAVARRMGLLYGVVPVCVPGHEHPAALLGALNTILKRRSLAAVGELVVVLASTQPTQRGATDTVMIHRVE